MFKEQFLSAALDHAEYGGRVKCRLPGEKEKTIWSGKGNMSGLYGISQYPYIGGKWKKSGDRFTKKLEKLVKIKGAVFRLQTGYSPDRLRMKYRDDLVWTSAGE